MQVGPEMPLVAKPLQAFALHVRALTLTDAPPVAVRVVVESGVHAPELLTMYSATICPGTMPCVSATANVLTLDAQLKCWSSSVGGLGGASAVIQIGFV